MIYNRFRRWTMRSLWRRAFEALARAELGDRQSTDGKPPRRTVLRRTEEGAAPQAIGRSRGGLATKIHAIVDERGHPIAIEVTRGRLGDVRVATALINAVPRRLGRNSASKATELLRFLKRAGLSPSFQ